MYPSAILPLLLLRHELSMQTATLLTLVQPRKIFTGTPGYFAGVVNSHCLNA